MKVHVRSGCAEDQVLLRFDYDTLFLEYFARGRDVLLSVALILCLEAAPSTACRK